MTAIESLNRFHSDLLKINEHYDHILKETYDDQNFLFPIFYEFSREISKIEGLDKLAQVILTDEATSLKTENFFEFYLRVLDKLSDLTNEIPPNELVPLRISIKKIQERSSNGEYLIAESIQNSLLLLRAEESYDYFYLNETKGWVVRYQKNANGSFDIFLFDNQKGVCEKQGGERAISFEIAAPFAYFKEVPFAEIFGPDVYNPSSMHAEILARIQKEQLDLTSAFKPFTNFQSKPPLEIGSEVHIEHAHLLKSFYAFLRFNLKNKDLYKAFNIITDQLLIMSLFSSLENEGNEKTYDKLSFLILVLKKVAHRLRKQKNNPYLNVIYEQCVNSLNSIRNKTEKLYRYYFLPPDYEAIIKQTGNQSDLIRISNKALIDHLASLGDVYPEIDLNHELFLNKLIQIKFSHLPESFLLSLEEVTKRIEEIEDVYPDFFLTYVNHVVELMPLPHLNSVWDRLDENQKKQGLVFLRKLVEKIVSYSFSNKKRFVLGAQTSSIKLLCISFFLTESLPLFSSLSHYFPSLKGYIKFTHSPNFSVTHLPDWVKRKEIIDYINERRENRCRFLSLSNFSKEDQEFVETLYQCNQGWFNLFENKFFRAKKDFPEIYRNYSKEQFIYHYLLTEDIIEDHDLKALSEFFRTAMHAYLMSSPMASSNKGFENTVHIGPSISFDLIYAKTERRKIDPLKVSIENFMLPILSRKNLATKVKYIDTENETIDRLSIVSDDSYLQLRLLEESVVESSLSVYQLMTKVKAHFFAVDSDSQLKLLMRYFFKIYVNRNKRENLPIEEEIDKHPQTSFLIINDFFSALSIYVQHNQNLKQVAFQLALFWYEIALNSGNQKLKLILKFFLDEQYKGFSENFLKLTTSLDLKKFGLLILKYIQLNADLYVPWEFYFNLGKAFQQAIEQEKITLTVHEKEVWADLRFKMLIQYRKVFLGNNLLEIGFNKFDLSSHSGKLKNLPLKITESSAFRRLFQKDLKHGHFDETDQALHFTDDQGQNYCITDENNFPNSLKRQFNDQWYSYLSPEKSAEVLKVPSVIAEESLCWIHPDGEDVIAFYLKEPQKVWFKKNVTGIQFEGADAEKGLSLELIDEQPILTEAKGLLTEHFFAYQSRWMQKGFFVNFRDLLCFPTLKTSVGDAYYFLRGLDGFYDKSNPDRKLTGCKYAFDNYTQHPLIKSYSTPLKVIALCVQTKVPVKKDFLIVPFQRYFAEPFSSTIYPLSPEKGVKSHLKSQEVLEIEVNEKGFIPDTVQKNLFCAYLSLIGKDYVQAVGFLNSIRPGSQLSAKEFKILRWMIDSAEQVIDHSSQSAAVKLNSYKIFIEQFNSILRTQEEIKLPGTDLENLLLSYFKHQSSIPNLIKLDLTKSSWIFEGFLLLPPTQFAVSNWEKRINDAAFNQVITETFSVENPTYDGLLALWEKPLTKPLSLKISPNLIDGFNRPFQQTISGGRYPESNFVNDYKFLSSEDKSLSEKWELMHIIETTTIEEFLKTALKLAFQKGNAAFDLPEVNPIYIYELNHSIQEWFSKLFENLPLPIPQETLINQHILNVQAEEPLIHAEDDLNLNKIKQNEILVGIRKPFDFLKIISASVPRIIFPRNHLKMESPFKKISMDELLGRELNFYDLEFEQGVNLLNQTKTYTIPLYVSLKKLKDFLEHYRIHSQKDYIIVQILELINRRPFKEELRADVILDEIKGTKTEIDVHAALQILFLDTAENKLNYLKKFNPSLQLLDIEIIEKKLVLFLEYSIVESVLKEAGRYLKEMNIDEKQNLNNPKNQALWQKICRLFDHENQYPINSQVYANTLLFEYLCGFRIKRMQAEKIQSLVDKIFAEGRDEKTVAAVFQAIMGGGKTSVILARLAKLISEKGKQPIFLAHPSQYASLKSTLCMNQFKRLGQEVIDIDFKRKDLTSTNVLKFICDQLHQAKQSKHLLLMKTSFLLILRLEFIDQIKNLLNPQHLDPLNLERIKLLAKIFYFIKKEVVLLGDEIDINSNVLDEVIFSAGELNVISDTSFEVLFEIYRVFSVHPVLSHLIKISKDDQSLVDKEVLEKEIFPLLVHELVENFDPINSLISIENTPSFKESLYDYLLNRINASLEDSLNEDDAIFFDRIELEEGERIKAGQQRHFLRMILELKMNGSEEVKKSLSQMAFTRELCYSILKVCLGKSFNHKYGFNEEGELKPFLGVSTPNETEFGNIYEKTGYYLQTAIKQDVSESFLSKYRTKMLETSFYSADIHRLNPSHTQEALKFKALTGCDLHGQWNENTIQEGVQFINQDVLKRLDFYKEFKDQFLTYHTSLLHAGPIALADMGAFFVGCAGSLWNKEAYARTLAEQCELEVGIEGQVLAKEFIDLKSNKSFLVETDKASPASILDAILKKRLDSFFRVKALIDLGVVLKHYRNETVAQEILDYEPLKGEIDAVLFLKKEKDKEFFCLLKRKDREFIPLKSATREEIEKHGITIDRLFIYYDELRSFGTDLPLDFQTISVLTVDPSSSTVRGFIQGLLRPREFFEMQQVDLVVRSEASSKIKNENNLLNSELLYECLIENQVQLKKIQLFRSALSQIQEVYASFIFNKWVSFFKDFEEDSLTENSKLLRNYQWLFSSNFVDEPLQLFFSLPKKKQAFEWIGHFHASVHKRFITANDAILSIEEIESLRPKSEAILDWAKQELVWVCSSADFQSTLQTEIQVEKQIEIEQEQQTQVENEIQNEMQKYAVRLDSKVADFWEWERKTPTPIDIKDYKMPPLDSLNQMLRKGFYEHAYHSIFPENLYLTENLARTYDLDLPVFHKDQKEIHYFLIFQEDDKFKAIYLDLKEAAFWRKEIHKYQLKTCWLSDLEGNSLNDNHPLPLDQKEWIKKKCHWAHFFNGNIVALRKAPEFIRSLKDENFALKLRYLKVKSLLNPNYKKILETDPLFSKQEGIEKQEVVDEPDFQLDFDEKSLNKQPFNLAKHFKPEHVPLIKREGYFSYLPTHLFQYIVPEQVNLLPNYKLRYLCLEEQIEVVSLEKVFWLKGEGLRYINEEQLPFINPEYLSDLTGDMQKKYQKFKIKEEGLKNFAKRVTPKMSKSILPRCVPFLNTSCLPYLKTKKQLEKVDPSLYQYLRASQYHLLPENHWHYIDQQKLQNYSLEDDLPEESKVFIEGIEGEDLNQLDAIWAPHFSDEQVEQITSVKFVEHLEDRQLAYLNAGFAMYLNDSQLNALDFRHTSIIRKFYDPKIFPKLSNAALAFLEKEQIEIVDDRETLIRLDPSSYQFFTSDQILLLNPAIEQDQKILKYLNFDQMAKLTKARQLEWIPFLNKETLLKIDGCQIANGNIYNVSIRRKLSAKQLQCYLGQKFIKEALDTEIKEITSLQWKEMDPLFIYQFFDSLSIEQIKHVPKKIKNFLSPQALYKWHDVEDNHIQDRIKGVLSVIFYPLILLSVFMFKLWVKSITQETRRICRQLILTPLLIFSRESYYSNL